MIGAEFNKQLSKLPKANRVNNKTERAEINSNNEARQWGKTYTGVKLTKTMGQN